MVFEGSFNGVSRKFKCVSLAPTPVKKSIKPHTSAQGVEVDVV